MLGAHAGTNRLDSTEPRIGGPYAHAYLDTTGQTCKSVGVTENGGQTNDSISVTASGQPIPPTGSPCPAGVQPIKLSGKVTTPNGECTYEVTVCYTSTGSFTVDCKGVTYTVTLAAPHSWGEFARGGAACSEVTATK